MTSLQPTTPEHGHIAPRSTAFVLGAVSAWVLVATLGTPTVHAQILDFNFGSSNGGWTLVGAFIDQDDPSGTPLPHNFTLGWTDTTNFPTELIGADPVGDGRGSLRMDASTLGDGVSGTGSYWIMKITSPDLSSSPQWQQRVYGYRVRLIANMSPGPLSVNLHVQVFDKDQQRVRNFSSGDPVAVTKSVWSTFEYNWSAESTFPTNYTIRSLEVHVWGSLTENYTSGSVHIDDVSGYPSADSSGPVTSNVNAAPNPAPVGTSIALTATVDDTNTGGSNIRSSEYSLDGTTWEPLEAADGSLDEVTEAVSAAFTRDIPGTYEICVRGTDANNLVGEPACALLEVYAPGGGFVTGGGWVYSYPGAFPANPDLAGRAHFAFSSRYKKGAARPDGSTRFVLQAGDLNFQSTTYDWLTVSQSGTNARVKGSGTINEAGQYGFMLWAGDGDVDANPSTVDSLRVQIWDEASRTVVYDNGFAPPGQPLNGGSIVVHRE